MELDSDEVVFERELSPEEIQEQVVYDLQSIFYHIERMRYYFEEPNWWSEESSIRQDNMSRMIHRMDHTQAFVRAALEKMGQDPSGFVTGSVTHAIDTAYFGRHLTEHEKKQRIAKAHLNTQTMIKDQHKFSLYE